MFGELDFYSYFCPGIIKKGTDMNKIKITREEALRRWNSAKETKRRMVERLETLARESYKEKTGEYPAGVEVW